MSSKLVLRKLHWLPIGAIIKYKVILLTFKALSNLAPQYLRDMFTVVEFRRYTGQSCCGVRLVEPRSNLKFGGDRAFSVFAPRL